MTIADSVVLLTDTNATTARLLCDSLEAGQDDVLTDPMSAMWRQDPQSFQRRSAN